MAYVENANVLANGVMLVGYCAVLDGHIEASEGTHQSAQFHMAVMKARLLKIVFHL